MSSTFQPEQLITLNYAYNCFKRKNILPLIGKQKAENQGEDMNHHAVCFKIVYHCSEKCFNLSLVCHDMVPLILKDVQSNMNSNVVLIKMFRMTSWLP